MGSCGLRPAGHFLQLCLALALPTEPLSCCPGPQNEPGQWQGNVPRPATVLCDVLIKLPRERNRGWYRPVGVEETNTPQPLV